MTTKVAGTRGTFAPVIEGAASPAGGDVSGVLGTFLPVSSPAEDVGFNAQRQAIIDGLNAAASPANGWNDEVRDKELVSAVVRTSNTVVTITLTAAGAYAIAGDETITVTIPGAALTGASPITATPTFIVTNEIVGGIPVIQHHRLRNF